MKKKTGISRPDPTRREAKGQAMMELALVLFLLLFIAFGVLDLARAFHATVVAANAASAGARYASEHPDCLATVAAGCTTTARQVAVDEAQSYGVVLNGSQVTFPPLDNTLSKVTVLVTYQFNTVLGNFFLSGSPITIKRQASMFVMVTR